MKQTETTFCGFFPAIGTKEISLFNRDQYINCGRRGIFYEKDKLIEMLENKYKAMNTAKIKIVEIKVSKEAIIDNSSNDRFGIKGNKKIPIIKIQNFEEAKRETKKMLATA